jgi:hypothetical protein
MIIYEHEIVPVVIDTTPILNTNETVSNPVSYLQRIDTDTDMTSLLTDAPTVNGNYITQKVQGLVSGGRYRLTCTFVTAAGVVRAVPVAIDCPS